MTILSKQKSKLFISLSLLSAASCAAPITSASDAIGPGDSDSKWVVGAAAGGFKNLYVGEDNDAWISPTVRYNGERVFFKDNSLNIHITKNYGLSAGLKFSLDGGFLLDDENYRDNEKLAGLNERDATILGGIYVNHDSDLGRLSFFSLTDVGSEHDGRMAELTYTFDLSAGDWHINPEIGASWASADIVNHHVGVSIGEATATRAQYEADDTFVTFAGLRARYEVNDRWDVEFRSSVAKLGSEITDSPIIQDDLFYQASFGVNYNF